AAFAANMIVLLPLAVWGARRAPTALRTRFVAMTIAASMLLVAGLLISLPDDTEHNLSNTAQCLLVIPAVGAVMSRPRSRTSALLLTALFVPVSVGTAVSYLGRPPLPIRFQNGLMQRTADAPLERFYEWVRAATPHSAVFIADP